MVALCNRADHYIFAVWFLLLLSIFFFPRLISAVADWMSTILLHMAWPIANLGFRSETCYTRLAGHAGPKKSPKIRLLGTIAQLCRAISSELRHISTIWKNLLNSNTSPTYPHNMVNFGPLASEIGSLVWNFGVPQLISTGFASWQRYCTAL